MPGSETSVICAVLCTNNFFQERNTFHPSDLIEHAVILYAVKCLLLIT